MNLVQKSVSQNKSFSSFQFFIGIVMLVGSFYQIGDSGYTRPFLLNFILALGVLTIVLGIRTREKVRIGRRYEAILSKEGKYNIEDLSHKVGRDTAEVMENLKMLISKGYIPYGYIDFSENVLILPDKFYSIRPKVEKKNLIEVICKSCGGQNFIEKNTGAKCDYCGNKL